MDISLKVFVRFVRTLPAASNKVSAIRKANHRRQLRIRSMAEFATAFGIVTGVIGLVPLCGTGYTFIERIVSADRHAEEQLIRLQIQKMVSARIGLLHS